HLINKIDFILMINTKLYSMFECTNTHLELTPLQLTFKTDKCLVDCAPNIILYLFFSMRIMHNQAQSLLPAAWILNRTWGNACCLQCMHFGDIQMQGFDETPTDQQHNEGKWQGAHNRGRLQCL